MKPWIILPLLLVFVLASCGKDTTVEDSPITDTAKQVETETITKKPFQEELKVSGKVVSKTETSISPLSSWVIKEVNVKVWDQVKKGQVLARIDTQANLSSISLNTANQSYSNTLEVYSTTKSALLKDIDTAKLQYENAQTTRDNTFSTTEKQLELAKAQLDAVTTQKENTTKTVDTSLTLANQSLDNAKLTLDNFNKNADETLKSLDIKKKSLADKKSGLIDTLETTISSTLSTTDTSLTNIDMILGVTERNKAYNDDYEIYLSAKNASNLNQAKDMFTQTNADFAKLKEKYHQDLSEADIVALYKECLVVVDEMNTLHEKMTDVLDDTIISQPLPESVLWGMKATNKASQSAILGIKSTLVTLNNSLTDLNNSLVDMDNSIVSTKTQLETQRNSLQKAVEISTSSVENTKASTTTSLDSLNSNESTTKIQLENTIESIKAQRQLAENGLEIAKNQYESAKSKLEAQLASTKTQLDSISGQRDQASQQVENSLIKAPYDGIITEKNIEVGALVSQWVKAFSLSSDAGKEVKVDVNSDNIKYLKEWQLVHISKSGIEGSGTITTIGVSPNASSKLFEIEVSIDSAELTESLVRGDYVDVSITKSVTQDFFIIVPFSSLIVGSNGDYSVYIVWKESKVESKKVSIGESNSSEIIINAGLQENDQIIVWGTLNVAPWDTVKVKKQ